MNISGEGVADSRPEVRVTQVVFYDQIGHVVPFDFDPDILSRGLEIFLSGYFKMLTDDDPLCENGIPVTQVGKFSLFAITQSTFYRFIIGQQYLKEMYEINCDN